MKQVIIKICDIKHFNQFQSIPHRFQIDDIDYRIIRTAESNDSTKIDSSVADIPYDLCIRHAFNPHSAVNYPTLAFDRSITLPRHDKARQMAWVKHLLEDQKDLTYTHLDASHVCTVTPHLPRFTIPENPCNSNRYVIRHGTGARSLGIMVTSRISDINLRMFFRDILALRKKEMKDVTNQMYVDICEKYHIEFKAGDGRSDNEAAEILHAGNFVITPFLDKPFKEYRLITGFGTNLMFERDHKADPSKYARQVIPSDILTKHDLEFLRKIQPHGSFDIWVHGATWGIFEFQPQYGHEDIPDDVHTPFLQKVLANICKHVNIVE